jgi:hypothetical protein
VSAEKIEIEGQPAYMLGHGYVNNPRFVRIDGTYAFVGLRGVEREWEDIQPFSEEDGVWLSDLGPGRLVFIPDP